MVEALETAVREHGERRWQELASILPGLGRDCAFLREPLIMTRPSDDEQCTP